MAHRFAVSFVLVGALAAIGMAALQSAQGSLRSQCVPYVIIDTRGSGEPQETLSPPGAWFRAEWERLHPSTSVVTFKNPYPAVGAWSFPGAGIKLPGAYNKSVVAGKTWLGQELSRLASNCRGQTKILLTGYSQGAQVTADVVQQGTVSDVFGVVLFGDPYFNSRDEVDRGDFERGRNGVLGRRPLFRAPLRKQVLSFCHDHDPVCQGPLHNGEYGTSQHKTYDKLGEPEEAAELLAADLAEPLVLYGVASSGSSLFGDLVGTGSESRVVVQNIESGAKTVIASAKDIPGNQPRTVVPEQLSPDGTYVTVLDRSDGQNESVLYSRSGKEITRWSYASAEPFAVFSPDSRALALPGGPSIPGLRVFRIASGRWEQYLSGEVVGSVSWSPDGKSIVAWAGSQIVVLRLSNQHLTVIGKGSVAKWGRQFIAYTCYPNDRPVLGGSDQICLSRPSGLGKRVILDGRRLLASPSGVGTLPIGWNTLGTRLLIYVGAQYDSRTTAQFPGCRTFLYDTTEQKVRPLSPPTLGSGLVPREWFGIALSHDGNSVLAARGTGICQNPLRSPKIGTTALSAVDIEVPTQTTRTLARSAFAAAWTR